MIAILRVFGQMLGALLVGATVGLVLYAVGDMTGLLDEMTRELPLPQFRRRLPFGGFVVLGGAVGLLIGLFLQLAQGSEE